MRQAQTPLEQASGSPPSHAWPIWKSSSVCPSQSSSSPLHVSANDVLGQSTPHLVQSEHESATLPEPLTRKYPKSHSVHCESPAPVHVTVVQLGIGVQLAQIESVVEVHAALVYVPAGQVVQAVQAVSFVAVHAALWNLPAVHVEHEEHTVSAVAVQAALWYLPAGHVEQGEHTASAVAVHATLA